MGYNVSTYLQVKNIGTTVEPETTVKAFEIVEHSKELIYTKYDTPTFWIEDIRTEEEELQIIWDADNKYCISKLAYEVKNGQTLNKNSGIEIGINPIVVGELHACQSYTVHLTAVDSNLTEVECKEKKSCFLPADMKYKHPESLKNISVANDTNEAIMKLTWNNPTDVFCVKNYTIFYKIVESENWLIEEIKDQTATEYLLYGLYGCEHYMFDVLLNIDLNTFNKSELETTAQEFQAPVIVTDDSLDLNLTQAVSAAKTITFTLSWQKPLNHSKCVKTYRVEMTSLEEGGNKTVELDASITSYDFDNLYPCTDYDFQVTPLTENEAGKETVFKTNTTEVREYLLNSYFKII